MPDPGLYVLDVIEIGPDKDITVGTADTIVNAFSIFMVHIASTFLL
jgi:hypothetical protein